MPIFALTRTLPSARRMLSIIILTASVVCSALLPGTGLAEASAGSVKQVPGYYHMSLGDFQVTALYDGAVSLATTLLAGISDSEIQAMLADMFVPVTNDGVQTAVNGFLVSTGEVKRRKSARFS